jgi:hypothetical protein
MLHKPIPSKPDQGSPVVSREKSAANHFARRILFGRNVKVFLGFSVSRGIRDYFFLRKTQVAKYFNRTPW